MNGPADTTEGATAAFRRSSRHRAPQRRAREDRRRNDRSARVLYAPGGSPWRRHHGLCRYARRARDHREFEGWSEHTTIESKTNFIGAATVGSRVVGETTPVHRGGRTMVWQTRVTTIEGKLVAIVMQTQLLL